MIHLLCVLIGLGLFLALLEPLLTLAVWLLAGSVMVGALTSAPWLLLIVLPALLIAFAAIGVKEARRYRQQQRSSEAWMAKCEAARRARLSASAPRPINPASAPATPCAPD
jgi:membrane protein implicated in regulation of membrane protease activity